MPIVDLTHNKDGSVRVRRSITMKVAIGLPPTAGSNFPQRLDHFAFQRKTIKQVERTVQTANGSMPSGRKVNQVAWEIDEEMQSFYGKDCREFWIVLVDDDPDQLFRTEMAWWSKTKCNCRGDGEVAKRLVQIKGVEEWRDHQPCANHGCVDYDAGRCTPSGDLYFLLADFPALGSICKLHTGSYQSIREIRSALEDLRSVTGGRLMGVKAKLTMRAENSSYLNGKNERVSGTKYVIGLELTAQDIKQLADGLASGLAFDNVRLRLGARSIEAVEDDDEERAGYQTPEFQPQNIIPTAEEQTMIAQGSAEAKRQTIEGMILGKPAPPAPATRQDPTTKHGITDADLPDSMFDPEAQTHDDEPIGPGQQYQAFTRAWVERNRDPEKVREFIRKLFHVEQSTLIPKSGFAQAMAWATSPLPEEPKPEQTPEEIKARNLFGLLSINLIEQGQIYDRNNGDWKMIVADLEAMA